MKFRGLSPFDFAQGQDDGFKGVRIENIYLGSALVEGTWLRSR
jgi:hypothetical protein